MDGHFDSDQRTRLLSYRSSDDRFGDGIGQGNDYPSAIEFGQQVVSTESHVSVGGDQDRQDIEDALPDRRCVGIR